MSFDATWTQALGALTVLLGAGFMLLAAVGVARLPDVYCRSHALGKAGTMGFLCLTLGYGLIASEPSWLKLVVAIVFQLTSIPLASHLFCLIAYQRGAPRHEPKARSEQPPPPR
ncbi:MAG: monovalent cation/H(+) antiporter subunit G [Polyangiaceae bacterium]|nr:monovalent cation/H(+) antiporter subunit G [Polyangiaceae bacterium]MCW5789472.1 monovalent cation/H(+) antiporter subunit G [Polyangiaceae bacterium]